MEKDKPVLWEETEWEMRMRSSKMVIVPIWQPSFSNSSLRHDCVVQLCEEGNATLDWNLGYQLSMCLGLKDSWGRRLCLLIWENSRQNRTIQSLGVSKGHGVLRKGEENPKDFWCHYLCLPSHCPLSINPNSPIPLCMLSVYPNMEVILFFKPNYCFTLWLYLQLASVNDLTDWQHLLTKETCLHGKSFCISLFWL